MYIVLSLEKDAFIERSYSHLSNLTKAEPEPEEMETVIHQVQLEDDDDDDELDDLKAEVEESDICEPNSYVGS